MSALKRLAVSDEGFVFDPATGDSFMLNGTGSVLLRGLREGLTTTALTDRLCSAYSVDRDQAGRDVDDFLLQMRSLKLV